MFKLVLEKAEETEIKLPTSAGSSKKQESSRKISISAEKTLENPLDCEEIQLVHSKGNQSWIFMEGLMLKLKLQYFGHLMRRADSFEKTWCWERLKVGGEGDDRGWDGWMASPTQWMWVWVNSGSWWWTGRPGVRQSMWFTKESDRPEQLNWNELKAASRNEH